MLVATFWAFVTFKITQEVHSIFREVPQVSNTIPANNDIEVPFDQTIIINFTNKVNKRSIESNLKLNGSPFKGKIVWSGNSLELFPEKEFGRGEEVTVTVEGLSSFFLPLRTYIFSFSVLSNPAVAMATPKGNMPQEVKEIVILFNKGVRTNNENILEITPNVEGKYRWVGNTAFIYEPTNLTKGQGYSVKINKDLESMDGGILQKGYSFDFVNYAPEMIALKAEEDDFTNFNPRGVFNICFNKPVDLESARSKIKLYESTSYNNEIELVFSASTESKSPYNQGWSPTCSTYIESPYIIKATPASEMKAGGQYTIKVEPGISDVSRSSNTLASKELGFTVAQPPAFTGFSITNNQKNVDYANSITLFFTSPMDGEVVGKSILVNGKSGFYAGFSSASVNSVTLYRNLEPSTSYVLTLPQGLRDKFGRLLPSGGSVTFTTKEKTPYLSLDIFPTDTKITSFASNVDKRVIVRSMNVNEIEYNLYSLRQDQFLVLASQNYGASYGTLKSFRKDELENAQLQKLGTWKKAFDISSDTITDTIYNFNKDAKYSIKPGFYVLNVRNPKSKSADVEEDTMLFYVGSHAITAKFAGDQALAWVASITDTKVVDNAKVTLFQTIIDPKNSAEVINASEKELSKYYKIIDTGQTDSDGILKLKTNGLLKVIDPRLLTLVAVKGSDVSIVGGNWSEGIYPYEFSSYTNISYDYDVNAKGPKQYKAYAFLDRTLYRPGQKAFYKVIIRGNDLHTFSMPDIKGEPVNVKVVGYDNNYNQTVVYENIFTGPDLTKNGEFVIPQTSTGYYDLVVSSPTNKFDSFSTSIMAQNYVRPDFEVIASVPDAAIRNENVNLSALARYFYGSPLGEAEVTYTVYKRDFVFNPITKPEYGMYNFYSQRRYFGDDYRYEGFEEQQLLSGGGKTNSKGEFALPLTTSNKEGVSEIYTLETEVLGESGRKFADSSEFVSHMSENYVGIMSKKYSGEKDKESDFTVIVLDTKEKPQSDIDVNINVFKRKYYRVLKQNTEGGSYYETSYEDIKVESKKVETNSKGIANFTIKPDDAGLFIVEATIIDSKGRLAVADTRLYVGSKGSSGYWEQQNHDRIELVADKKEYNVGDTAKILATSNIEKSMGLLSVEAEGVIYHKVFKQNSSADTVDLPITAKFVPNVYVSAVIVGPGKNVFSPSQFKMGVLNIKVASEQYNLNVQVDSDKNSYKPKENGTLSVLVKDQKGNPVKNAEVTVALVDDSLMTMAPIKRGDIFDYFYQARRLSVFTVQSLINSLDRINANTEIGAKGGSGSKGGAGGEYIDLTRSNFSETALWLPKTYTDQNGVVKVPFVLTDSTTRWNAFVLATSPEGGKFGQNIALFTSSRSFFTDPALPRFIRDKDVFELAGVVHNTTSKDAELTLNVETKNLNIKGGSAKTVTVKSGDSMRVGFDATGSGTGAGFVKFTLLNNGKTVDIVEKDIPVLPFGVEQVQSYFNTANFEGLEEVTVSKEVDKSNSDISVKAYSSLLGASNELNNNLYAYAYLCNEQISSKLLPQIYQLRFNKNQKLDVNNYQLDQDIKQGINKLVGTQHTSGGWGFWQSSDPDVHNTARVLEILLEAKKDGYKIDNDVVKKATSYLSSNLLRTNEVDPYDIYVLQLSGYDASSLISSVYNSRASQMSDYDSAYLILAMKANQHDWKAQIERLQGFIFLHADYGSGRVFWNSPKNGWYIGDDSTPTAAVLRALNHTNPTNPMAKLAISHLVQDSMRAKREVNTYAARTASVAILENYLATKTKLRDTRVEVFINDKNVANGDIKKFSFVPFEFSTKLTNDFVKEGTNKVKLDFKQGGSNFYNVSLNYLLPFTKVESYSNQLGLSRSYYDTEGNEVTNNKFKAGQTYYVKLLIAAPNTRRNLVIEDYLPAGFEGVNSSLQNEVSTKQHIVREKTQGEEKAYEMYYSHMDMMDDRTAIFADIMSQGLYKYTYAVKAVTPGTYKLRPAQAYEMYAPEIRSNTQGYEITVE